tara:strand:- start:1130 stop:1747 length:618 start_codon:yes stop_codon:yes gene_type:complete
LTVIANPSKQGSVKNILREKARINVIKNMKFKHIKTIMAALILGGAFLSQPVHVSAQEEPQLISTHGPWSAYKFKENGQWVCYMVSQPQTDEGNYTSRGEIYALITHRPAENTKHVFSYMAGYPYKKDSRVTVDIDGNTYQLFTHQETAWAPDSNTDYKLKNAITAGSRMIVKGTSSRGTATTDTYSLSGTTDAYTAISKACGVN